MKKLLSLLLALIVVFSLVACAPTDNKQGNQQTGTPEDPVTITLYPLNANLTSGTVGGWLGEYLLSKGIILEIWPYSDEKFTAMVTAGNLPDMLYVSNKVPLDELSESNLLLDLDPYMDLLPHIAENAQIQSALEYTREYVSAGVTNMVPLLVGGATKTIDTERAAVKLYWEAYEQIGCPEIKTWDDLIDVLKQMKEVYPKSAVGDQTYGARLFANDSSYFYSIYNWYVVNGVDVGELPYFIEVDTVNESFDYILEDDSQYKAGLAFFNKLYREGLLDPESMNKDRTTQQTAVTAGGSLAGWPGAPGWEQYGYYPVYIEESVSFRNESGNILGNGSYISISAQSEHIETCLKLLDMMANPDEIMVLREGPKGELWDVDDNGKAYITDKGYRYYAHGDKVKINGEEYSLYNTPYILNTGAMTSYGVPYALAGSDEMLEYNAATDLMNSWKETYPGYSGFRELLTEKEQFINDPFHSSASKFAEAISDENKLIQKAAKDIIVQASWKMIYAETDAEFERLWDAAIAECEAAGIKAIYEWRVAELEEGIEIKNSFFDK